MEDKLFKLKRLTPIPLIGKVVRLICEVNLSSKKSKEALEEFQLFYEEITKNKVNNRVKRVRQTTVSA